MKQTFRSVSFGYLSKQRRNSLTPPCSIKRSEFDGVSSVTFHRQLQHPFKNGIDKIQSKSKNIKI